MEGVTGGRVCAPVWAAIMRDAPTILSELDRIAALPLESDQNDIKVNSPKQRPSAGVVEPLPTELKVDTAPEDAGLNSAAPLEQPDVDSTPPVVPDSLDVPKPSETPQPSIPSPTTVRIKKPEVKPDPEVEVLICSDSNLRANDYCVEVVRQLMPKSKAPKRTCNQHGAQPDERPN
jgi:hypothetical protein